MDSGDVIMPKLLRLCLGCIDFESLLQHLYIFNDQLTIIYSLNNCLISYENRSCRICWYVNGDLFDAAS